MDLREVLAGRPDAFGPTWAPDGRRLAFVASSRAGFRLFVLTVSNCRLTSIEPEHPDVHVDFPDWSPDGRLFAFSAESATLEGGIFVMRSVSLNGGRPPVRRSPARGRREPADRVPAR